MFIDYGVAWKNASYCYRSIKLLLYQWLGSGVLYRQMYCTRCIIKQLYKWYNVEMKEKKLLI